MSDADKDAGITGDPPAPNPPAPPAAPPAPAAPSAAPTEPHSGNMEERMKNQETLTGSLLAAVTGLTDAITALGKPDAKPVKVPWTHRGGKRHD